MGAFSTDGKVGAAKNGQVDTVRNFTLGDTTLIGANKVAIYAIVGEVLSGSAAITLDTGFTAMIALSAPTTGGGFVAILPDGTDAAVGEYIWVRASAPITLMTA